MAQKLSHSRPLAEEYISSNVLKDKSRKRKKNELALIQDSSIDEKSSRKILKVRQELADEYLRDEKGDNKIDDRNIFSLRSDYIAEKTSNDESDIFEDDDDWIDETEVTDSEEVQQP